MTKSKYIPYGRQDIDSTDINAVKKVLNSDFLTQGPEVENFEKEISKKVNAKYSISVNSATSALHLACMALEVGEKDIVWTSPNTFVASANCALYCGAKIDFVDIDISTNNISVEKLEEKLITAKKTGKLPKVVIVVHLTGRPCEMDKIYKLSKIYNFKIIEDASHAIGASYKKSLIGSCKWSDITVFSLHPVKIITSGEGGIICTNNKILNKKCRLLRTHGITRNINDFKYKNQGLWHYEQHLLGYNYRMTDIHAALGKSQLRKIKSFINKRNSIAKKYDHFFEDTHLELPCIENKDYLVSSFHLYVIKLFHDDHIKNHKKIFKNLRKKGIGVNLHYSPVHLQPHYKKLGFSEGDFPNAEKYGKTAISIPIYPKLSLCDQEYVVKSVVEELKAV